MLEKLFTNILDTPCLTEQVKQVHYKHNLLQLLRQYFPFLVNLFSY